MNPIIREATMADCEAIRRLNVQLGYDYPVDATARHLASVLHKPYVKIYVAEDEREIVGYIHATDNECTYVDDMKEVLALVVDEQSRVRGVGRALLRAAENWAKENGAKGIHLNSGVDRTGAHQFYRACGYTNLKDHKTFIKRFEG